MPTLTFHLDEVSPLEQRLRLDRTATLPDLEIQVLDQGVPVNITGAAVTFTMTDSTGSPKVAAAAGVVSDGPNGKASYTWLAIDVDTDGVFEGQFKIVPTGGGQYLVPNATTQRLLIIVGRIAAAGVPSLTTLIPHAPSHVLAGTDEIDGDKLGIDFVPANYTRDLLPAEVNNLQQLTAHLKGLDTAVAGVGGGTILFPHAIGRLYGLPHANATIQATSNKLVAAPVKLDTARTYDKIYAKITTAGTGEYAVGIYADSNGSPGALLVDSGDLDPTSTGLKSKAISFKPSSPDVWLAARATGTPSVNAAAALFRDALQPGTLESVFVGKVTGGVSRDSVGTGALPDPFNHTASIGVGVMQLVLLKAGS